MKYDALCNSSVNSFDSLGVTRPNVQILCHLFVLVWKKSSQVREILVQGATLLRRTQSNIVRVKLNFATYVLQNFKCFSTSVLLQTCPDHHASSFPVYLAHDGDLHVSFFLLSPDLYTEHRSKHRGYHSWRKCRKALSRLCVILMDSSASSPTHTTDRFIREPHV
jgi:hypothetical protein